MFQENSNKIGFKLGLVIILSFVLLLPTFLIMALINDRQITREQAISEVSDKWGNQQLIAGPVLSVPYSASVQDQVGNIKQVIQYAHFLPDSLNIEGQIKPEIRSRGIYDVVVYGSTLKLSGNFSNPDFAEFNIAAKDILWPEAFVSLGIPDMRGIQKTVNLKWDNLDYQFKPGIETKDVIASGVSVSVPVGAKQNYPFSLELDLNGSKELSFVPAGKETKVRLAGNWPSPSFTGSFLPENYDLSDNGFNAQWQVLNLNRNFPQSWLGPNEEIQNSAFGVNLLIPVDEYQRSMRTVKYAILLIGLTFIAFFFVEIFNKRRIHPVQYLLVGAALCLFYLLLLSISEQLNFNWAYVISALATIAMITVYSKHILRNIKLTIWQALILAVLYAFIYIIIQLEDYALLVGSLGVFIVLAVVMYVSKKIDWYGEEKS